VRVGVPDLDERVGDRIAPRVDDAADDLDPLARRVGPRDDLLVLVDQGVVEEWADGLRGCLLAHGQPVTGVAARPRRTMSKR
jgi:hypothetical protein